MCGFLWFLAGLLLFLAALGVPFACCGMSVTHGMAFGVQWQVELFNPLQVPLEVQGLTLSYVFTAEEDGGKEGSAEGVSGGDEVGLGGQEPWDDGDAGQDSASAQVRNRRVVYADGVCVCLCVCLCVLCVCVLVAELSLAARWSRVVAERSW